MNYLDDLCDGTIKLSDRWGAWYAGFFCEILECYVTSSLCAKVVVWHPLLCTQVTHYRESRYLCIFPLESVPEELCGGRKMKKIRVYKTQISGLSGPIVYKSVDDVIEELRSMLGEDIDIGDTFTVEVDEMTEEEFDELPEFPGY